MNLRSDGGEQGVFQMCSSAGGIDNILKVGLQVDIVVNPITIGQLDGGFVLLCGRQECSGDPQARFVASFAGENTRAGNAATQMKMIIVAIFFGQGTHKKKVE